MTFYLNTVKDATWLPDNYADAPAKEDKRTTVGHRNKKIMHVLVDRNVTKGRYERCRTHVRHLATSAAYISAGPKSISRYSSAQYCIRAVLGRIFNLMIVSNYNTAVGSAVRKMEQAQRLLRTL